MCRSFQLIVSFFVLVTGAVLRGDEPPPPFAAAFAPSECEAATLSPDGKHVAAIMRNNGTLSAQVIDVDKMAAVASVLISKDLTGHRGGSQIHWTAGGRIVAQIGDRDIIALNGDGTAAKWLIDWTREGWYRPAPAVVTDPFYNPLVPPTSPVFYENPTGPRTPLRRVKIVALPAGEPDYIYVEGIKGREFALYRIHLRTGELETVRSEFVEGMLAYDRQGRTRLRLSDEGIPRRWYLRSADELKEKWTPLARGLSAPDAGALDLSVTSLFGTRSFPLGFAEDPNLLYLASNAGRDTYGIYALDLRTGRRMSFALEQPAFDLASPLGNLGSVFDTVPEPILVVDRGSGALMGVRCLGLRSTTLWVDREIAALQNRLEARFPVLNVQIEQWDATRARILVQLFTRSNPGSYAIFEPASGRFQPVISCGPKESPLQPMRTVAWGFKRPEGTTLTGEITMPARPRATPVPVVVFFRQSEWSRQLMRYNPQVALLAHLGFAVLEVNHRGLAGFGTAHWTAGRLTADAVAGEDALAAVDHLAPELRLDQRKVVFFGSAMGGYFALRAAQLFPERTAAVATVNPVANLSEWIAPSVELSLSSRLRYTAISWFFGPDAKTRQHRSPLEQAPAVKSPMLIVTGHERSSSWFTDYDAMRKKTLSAGGKFQLERVVRGANESEMFSARLMVPVVTFLEQTFPRAAADPAGGNTGAAKP